MSLRGETISAVKMVNIVDGGVWTSVRPTASKRHAVLALALAAMAMSVPSRSDAQIVAPSQVTPQSIRPAGGSGSYDIPFSEGVPAQMPAGAEDLTVFVGDVRIEGGFPELDNAIEPLLREIRGARVKVSRIYDVARRIERVYAHAGYPLVRITIPPQKLVDHGPLAIVVVDGFIEDIDVTGVPERVRSVVFARTRSLIGRHPIRLEEIERALLIAGDTPGLRLRSTFARGSANGGTRLVLEGEHRVVSGSTGGDDRLASSLGTWQLRGSVAANSVLGLGEQIYGTVGLSADLRAAAAGSAPLSIYGGGVVVPIGEDGLTLNSEYTHSTTRTMAAPGVPGSLGTFERVALRLRDPLIRTRAASLFMNASFEYVSQQIGAPAFNVLLNNDRYAVARMGPDYSALLPWGAPVQLGASLSQGLGGRSGLDALLSHVPLSRQGATPEFTKANASFVVSQPLLDGLRVDVIGLGQVSFGKPLLQPEQFALDGSNAVSAFASGTILADQGATLRGELIYPLVMRAGDASWTLSPYLFAAMGHGELLVPTVLEQSVFNAGALGLGTRNSVQPFAGSTSLNIALEVARQFSDIQGLRQGWRGNVNASMEF